MNIKWKALTGLAVVAGLVIGPLVATGASAEEVVDPTAVVEVVEETVTEPVAESAPEPAPEAEPVVEEPAAPVEEKAPSEEPAPAPVAPVASVQTESQPDFICDEDGDGWQVKVDWDGDGNPTVTAPEGFLIDAYCVKAGTTKHIIEVAPPAASVEIDHPLKDSVSHYQVHLVPVPDDPDPVINECTTGVNTHSTNLNDLWTNVDTRSAGHLEYVEGGLHIWTDDNSSNAKVSEGMAVNIPLHDVGVLDIDWTGSTPAPGINLFVDITGDGVPDGTLVYEEVYGQDLWVTNGSAQALKDASVHTGGNGSENHGTIDHYLTTFPEATVVGIAYALGSGVLGDGVIHSITVGCATHTFDFEARVVPVPTTFDAPVTAADCDTDGALPTLGEFANVSLAWDREFDGPGVYTLTATALNGYEFPGGGTERTKDFTVQAATGYQSEDPEAECFLAPPPVKAPGAPTWFDNCGTENDTYVVPGDNDAFTYEVVEEGDAVTVTAVLRNPEVDSFPEGAETEWSYTFTDEECPVATPPAPASRGLAVTGGGDVSPLLPLGGGLAAVLGLTLIVYSILRRRVSA